MTNHDEGTINLDDLPTCEQSDAARDTDAPAARAYIHSHGFADEDALVTMLGIGVSAA